MRRVLVLAYYFPPLGGSGVQRITKLVRYLPRAGWHAEVVTPHPGRYVARDVSLLREAEAAGVAVHRTRTLDPSRVGQGVAGSAPYADRQRRWARRLTSLLFVPDNKLGWLPFALATARARLREQPFDAILSTAPPYTSHLVAARLGAETGLPVVLDYRDDWLGNPRHRYPTRAHLALHRTLERYALRRAALVTTINETIAEALCARQPGAAAVEVVPQGFDPADFEAPLPPRTSDRMQVVYTGVFYDEQRPDVFLRAFAEALPQMEGPGAEAVFAGLVPPYFDRLVAELGLAGRVRYVGYLPHAASVALARAADVVWMTVGEAPGAAQISTSKLFEYVGTRRPILALVPPGEAARAAEAYGAAHVAGPSDQRGVRDALLALHDQWQRGALPIPDETYLQAHDRITLAHRMAELLDTVVVERGAAARR